MSYLKEIQDFESSYNQSYSIKKGSTTLSFVDTFFNFQDASMWVQYHLEEHSDPNEWHLEQCSINYMNGAYRAGVVFSKTQKDLFMGDPLGR